MEGFLSFFGNLSDAGKLMWIVVCMLLFWLLEGQYPLAALRYNKWRHAAPNLVFLSTTVLINALFGIVTAGIFVWMSNQHFGLLYLVNLPWWVELILAVLLLDLLAQYLVHYLLHKVKFMWRFHMVHHSDTAVDVTTGTRHHPGDYIMRECFSLLAIVISGMPFAYYIFYRLLTVLFTYFTHANLNLPVAFDKLWSYVFISPHMHKFHHHYERPWTDSNYGNIFSIWDRLFGTFVYDDPLKIRYGLDVLQDNTSDQLGYQLKLPFDGRVKTDR